MTEQCLNKETKGRMTRIIDDYIKEWYLRQLKTFAELKTELVPEEMKEKAINYLRITRKNIDDIPVCK